MKILVSGLVLLFSASVFASNCPKYIISGVKLTKEEKKAIQMKGLTSSIFDSSAGKNSSSSINYSEGQRVLYLDVKDATEQLGYEKMSVVEVMQVAVAEKLEIHDEQSVKGLLPTESLIVGKSHIYSKDARKTLTESILGLPTCSF